MNAVQYSISYGREGVFETLKMMAALAREGRKNFQIRERSLQIVRNLPGKDYRQEISQLFYYVRDDIRYVQDVLDIETLHTPELILHQMQGDCDDKCILLASMLMSIGHPCRYVACGFGDTESGYEHVYLETKLGANYWMPLDATEPIEPGEVPAIFDNYMRVHI